VEPIKKKSNVIKKPTTKTEMLRRNGPVIKSIESAMRPKESLWWERFVVGFQPGVKERKRELVVTDGQSGILTTF